MQKLIQNLKWDSLTFCEISRQQSRKNRRVVYSEWLTSGNSLIIACGQLNEQRMLLLPQMPTRIRRDTVGFHHPFRFQPQKERPPTLTSQIEREKNPRNSYLKKKKKATSDTLALSPGLTILTKSVQFNLPGLSGAVGLKAKNGCLVQGQRAELWSSSVETDRSIMGSGFSHKAADLIC